MLSIMLCLRSSKHSLFSDQRVNDYFSQEILSYSNHHLSQHFAAIKKSCRHVCFTYLPIDGTMRRPSKTNGSKMFKVVFSSKVWNCFSSKKLLKPMFVGLNLSALKIKVSETYRTPAFYFTVSDFHRVRPGLNKICFIMI